MGLGVFGLSDDIGAGAVLGADGLTRTGSMGSEMGQEGLGSAQGDYFK